MKIRPTLLALSAVTLASCSQQSDPINITGSSTVYPFTKAVADRYATTEGARAPKLESVGTVAGMQTFCAGPGAPDILDASRRMTRKDYDHCKTNKVGEILEIPVGLDGIALVEAAAGPKLSLTNKDIYLALAATPGGQPNTAKTWKDVNPALPAVAIKVLGPPTTSGTRDSFVDLIVEPGCLAADPQAEALRASSDPAKFDTLCRQLRADGPLGAAGEDDTATAKGLESDPSALGLLGYSYLEREGAKLRAVPINGVVPTAATIGAGQYPGVRQLYLYVKKAHISAKPSIQTFLNLYAEMWRPGGELAKAGLIPLSDKANNRSQATVKNGFAMEADELP